MADVLCLVLDLLGERLWFMSSFLPIMFGFIQGIMTFFNLSLEVFEVFVLIFHVAPKVYTFTFIFPVLRVNITLFVTKLFLHRIRSLLLVVGYLTLNLVPCLTGFVFSLFK